MGQSLRAKFFSWTPFQVNHLEHHQHAEFTVGRRSEREGSAYCCLTQTPVNDFIKRLITGESFSQSLDSQFCTTGP